MSARIPTKTPKGHTMSLLTMRRAVIACFALAVLASSGLAQTEPPAKMKERFQAADKNHDGFLDREEYNQLVVEAFYFRDKNKDGYLTVDELTGVVSPEVFKAIDRKGDGKLTLDEWTNALFVDFDRADTNHDGQLSYEELETYVRTSGR